MITSPYVIAVIRGGAPERSSLSHGRDMLRSLEQHFFKVVDVIVDTFGNWHSDGLKTDAHKVFTRATHYIDLVYVHDKQAIHHTLARKMGIVHLFGHDALFDFDKENMYRVLSQLHVTIPHSDVIRVVDGVDEKVLRTIWHTYHTPLLVRPAQKTSTKGILVRGYHMLAQTIARLHAHGEDVQLLTYRPAKHYHVVAVPGLRKTQVYTTLPTEYSGDMRELPHDRSSHALSRSPSSVRTQIESLAQEVAQSLPYSFVALDIIESKAGYKVVRVDPSPSLVEGSRSKISLDQTGVSIGELVTHMIDVEEMARIKRRTSSPVGV